MNRTPLIRRLRAADKKGKGTALDRDELARVYTAARAKLGAGDEWVERMRQAVLAGSGFRLDATFASAALGLLAPK